MGEAVVVGERLRGSRGVFEEKTLPNAVNIRVNSNPLKIGHVRLSDCLDVFLFI